MALYRFAIVDDKDRGVEMSISLSMPMAVMRGKGPTFSAAVGDLVEDIDKKNLSEKVVSELFKVKRVLEDLGERLEKI